MTTGSGTPGRRASSWDEVRARLVDHLATMTSDDDLTTVIASGGDRPAPPDAPKRGLFRKKPAPPISIYVQYAGDVGPHHGFVGECVGIAGPDLRADQQRQLTDLGYAAPRTEGALQENWTREFTSAEVALAADTGVSALKILGATPQEIQFDVF